MTPKQSIHRILALAILAATAFLSQALHAQQTEQFSVPFAFDCGAKHFYPGTYTVSMSDVNMLLVSNRAQTGMALSQTSVDASRPANGWLVFRKYGNRYFLAEFHPAYKGIVADLPRSKNERSIARDYAMNLAADQGRVRLAALDNTNPVFPAR